jgi:hypothetical protein
VLTNDFDGLTLWHNLYGARATSGLLSRGEFGAIGAGRLLDLFDKRKITSTFFVPSNTALHFPSVVQQMVNDGHELAHHGVDHEDPTQVRPLTHTPLMFKRDAQGPAIMRNFDSCSTFVDSLAGASLPAAPSSAQLACARDKHGAACVRLMSVDG